MKDIASPRPLSLSEILRIVSDPDAVTRGTRAHDEGRLRHLAQRGRWIFAQASAGGGAGALPRISQQDAYMTRVSLGEKVEARCTCWAGRRRPFCLHAVALMLAWAHDPGAFATSEPQEPTRTRRGVKTGKVDPKDRMRHGIAQVEVFLRELAVSGIASVDEERVSFVRILAEHLREEKLRRVSARVHALADLLEKAAEGEELDVVRYAGLVAETLLMARRVQRHLDGEAIPPREVEELIGKTWRPADRAPVHGMDLVEYAYLRWETPDRFVIREQRYVDLRDGRHYAEKQILPYFLEARTQAPPGHEGTVLRDARAGAYPGYPPTRLDHVQGRAEPLARADVDRLLAGCLASVDAAVAALQSHRRDPFAPETLPVAVRVEALLVGDDGLRLVDADGLALPIPSSPALEARLADLLRGAPLRAVLGNLRRVGAHAVLEPLAVVTDTLRRIGVVPADGPDETPASGSLQDIRQGLALALADGLSTLAPRTVDPLAAALRDLGLGSQATLLEDTLREPDPAARLDDVVRLLHVLGLALLRLTAAQPASGGVAVPGYPSVRVARPASRLGRVETVRALMDGTLTRFDAALHFAHEAVDLEAGLSIWADASALPALLEAARANPDRAVALARKILLLPGARAARAAAVRVLQTAAPRADADAALASVASNDSDPALRVLAGGPPVAPEAWRANVWLLAHGSPRDRRIEAVRWLAGSGALEAVPSLQHAMATQEPAVRDAAAIALALLGDTAQVEPMIRALGAAMRDEPSLVDGRAAAHALAHLGDVRGAVALVDAFAAGWRPGIIADALPHAGAVLLTSLAALIEQRPEIARRKALETYLRSLPGDALRAFLRGREGLHPAFTAAIQRIIGPVSGQG